MKNNFFPISIENDAYFYEGYILGLKQNATRFEIEWLDKPKLNLLQEFVDHLQLQFRSSNSATNPKLIGQSEFHEANFELLKIFNLMTDLANLPITESIIIEADEKDKSIFKIFIPCQSMYVQSIKNILIQTLRCHSAIYQSNSQEFFDRATENCKKIANENRIKTSTNSFVTCARALNIPVMDIFDTTMMFGQGAKSEWLDNAFTGVTPRNSVIIARRKPAALMTMRAAGLPVPDFKIALSEAHAVECAKELGFPVVIKPTNLDGGDGVSTELMDPNAVREAYLYAQKFSPNVMVEKHIYGRDYRILIYKGEVVAAIERFAGGVTGDGVSSIRDLLHKVNADRKNPNGTSKLIPIEFDDEAKLLLRNRNISETYVPKVDEFIRLRRAANFSRGGSVKAARDHMHPDNRDLAIQAAEALKLDLAGIDLLMPDISHSWHSGGAAICEINSSPFLGNPKVVDLFTPLLKKIVTGDGRIPTLVFLNATFSSDQIVSLFNNLSELGLTLGYSDPNGRYIGRAMAGPGMIGAYYNAKALLSNKKVECAVMMFEGPDFMSKGLPVDEIDVAIDFGSDNIGGSSHADKLREAVYKIAHEFFDCKAINTEFLLNHVKSSSENKKPQILSKPEFFAFLKLKIDEALIRHNTQREEPSV